MKKSWLFRRMIWYIHKIISVSFILKIDFDILRWTHTKSISVHSFARDLMNCLWWSKSIFYKKLLRISKKSKLYETTDSHAMYYYSWTKLYDTFQEVVKWSLRFGAYECVLYDINTFKPYLRLCLKKLRIKNYYFVRPSKDIRCVSFQL